MLWSKEDLNHQDGCADNDGAICNIEVWPDILTDIELEKIDDVPCEHSIPEIAQGASENQRQRERSAIQSVRVPPQQSRHHYERQQREED